MKILFLSRWYPFPPTNGSKLRIYNLLQGLAECHQVSILSFAAEPEITPDMEKPTSTFEEIRVVPWIPFNPTSRTARSGFFSRTPRAYLDTFSPALAQNLQQMLADGDFDLVIASQIDMAAYGRFFRGMPAVFEEAEVGVLYDQYRQAGSMLKQIRYYLTWLKHRRFLDATLRYFDACTVVSEQERGLLAQAVPAHPPIHVIPNAVDLNSYRDIDENSQPDTMIFTGSLSYTPNHEAMVWFIREILPLVQDEVPGARLTITGDHQGRTLPNGKHIHLTGFVDDVRPLVAGAWCSVVPILSGGGTRLKILEAIALGTPVVATPKGAEGLELSHPEEILIADSPQDFARAVVTVLKDARLRRELATRALQKVEDRYNWAGILPGFIHQLEEIVK